MVSGHLGWVLVPDKETTRQSQKIARELNENANYLVNRAHVSLFHGNFKQIPEKFVKETLEVISDLKGQSFALENISSYGDRFLFWDVKKPYTQIQKAHNYIVRLYSRYISKAKTQAEKENLSVNKKQSVNLKKFGYPLVFDQYRPHVTLLYKSGKINTKSKKPWKFYVEDVNFVEIGNFGTIKKVLF